MSYDEPHGFETRDGWKDIILSTHNKLKYIDSGYKISQIKQKFGGLRYYYDISFNSYDDIRREIMDDVVAAAEVDASHTCEMCGTDKYNAGVETRTDYYFYYTYCKECSDKFIEQRDKMRESHA